jgi:hypothetical protein
MAPGTAVEIEARPQAQCYTFDFVEGGEPGLEECHRLSIQPGNRSADSG